MKETCHHFFVHPTTTLHRRYEALRAFFVQQRSLKESAQQFGYSYGRLCNLVHQFRTQCMLPSNFPPFPAAVLGTTGPPRSHQPAPSTPRATGES